MDIRRLQCFQAVVEEKALTKAAQRLRLAPSALSRQISLLEHEIGKQLFSREAKRLAPTSEGLYLYERCAALLRDISHLRQDVASFASMPTGNVTFGAPPSLRDMVSLPVLAKLLRNYPDVTVSVEEGMTMLLRDRIAAGSLDLAVIATVEPAGNMQLFPLARESLVLVGPLSAALSPAKPVKVSQVLDLSLITSPPTNSLRKLLDTAAHKLRRAPKVRIETNLAETLIGCVERGQGFGILPYSGAHEAAERGSVTIAPIQGLNISWALARRTNLVTSPAMRMLQDTLLAHVASVAETAAWPTSKRL
jgi:LysR family nitrogen assimilation transcriptional regulator